jgi:outer membrane protein OmpA-like peptidoglycan-associated protein
VIPWREGRGQRSGSGRTRALWGVFATGLLATGDARGEDFSRRLSLRLEGGAGIMLTGYQQDVLSQRLAVQGAARAGIALVGPLAVQLGGESALFPNGAGGGQLWVVGCGLRVEPSLGRVARLSVDGNAGAGFTGPLVRLAYDAGAGVEFNAASFLSVGPSVRFHHVVATQGDTSGSAMFVTGGAIVTVRVPSEIPRAGRDTDADGVTDGEDLCVELPAGARPDAARPGCPLLDRDADGVPDRDDLCPTSAAGATPDRSRAGCPAGDSDGDRVLDGDDLCPTAAVGPHPDPSRRGCPDGDDDNDRVRNSIDQCRTQHHGMHSDPARPGCPAPDRDNDNVPDATDACPTEPGQPHPDRARNGCAGMVRVEEGEIRTLEPVFFETNGVRILPRSERLLQSMADALLGSPEIARLGIHGHTDDVGEDGQNLELSRRRAEAVLQWLVRHNVADRRLEAQGFGESRPLVPGQSEQARAVNRRVEFRILQRTSDSSADGSM